MNIIAIDPGNFRSAFAVMAAGDCAPVRAGLRENAMMRQTLAGEIERGEIACVVIERVASYGMAVGRDVFETCEWIGRFTELAEGLGAPVDYIYRLEEKEWLCHNTRARDSNVRAALIARFARHDLKNGKGTKANPDVFYGFSADMWAAAAVGATWQLKRGYLRASP